MIVGFSKLFADIIHSTVWREPMHVKVVWITMLAMADRHGQVMASIPGLADSAKVSLEECLEALQVFLSPDEYSRTKDYEGRRIVEIDGGWLLLNYEKFRERRDDEEQRLQTRERVRRHRANAKALGNIVTEGVTETECNDITDAESDAESEPKKKSPKKKPLLITRPDLANDTAYVAWLCDHKKYTSLDVKGKYDKMLAWCEKKDETPSRQRLIAWLNKDLKDMPITTTTQNFGCSICENHPNRNQITIKSGGYIFNTELNQVQECVCRRTNGST